MVNRNAQRIEDSKLHIHSLLDETTVTPVIRSHRREPRFQVNRRAVGFALAAVIGAGTITASSADTAMPAQAATPPAIQTMPFTHSVESRATSTVSRSTTRKASARAVKRNKAVSFALAQRGDRYKWGASGPNRYDCSGLVMKSFKKAGIKLPHSTRKIVKKGVRVSRKNLRRGDIVFPSRGHVGIYLGNGKMVHASSSKRKVVVAKVYAFYTARRVL